MIDGKSKHLLKYQFQLHSLNAQKEELSGYS